MGSARTACHSTVYSIMIIVIRAAFFSEYLKTLNVSKDPGQVCKINSYGLYRRSQSYFFAIYKI